LLSALPAGAELTLQTVRADKIFYDPGQEAQFTVVVANPDAAAASATLRVELLSDVATAAPLGEQAVTVPAKGESTWTGKAPMQPVLGMELRAILLREGQPLATKSDYFSCARSVHQVLQFGLANWGNWQFSGTMDKIRDTYPRQFAAELRSNYANCVEKFGWAPSDFDCMTPPYDRWWAGQTTYNECKPNMIAIIAALHAQGIKAVTYGKQSGGGNVGLETLRRHPDVGMYNNGRYVGDNYDVGTLDFYAALGPPHEGEQRPVPGSPEEMEKAGYAGAAWYAPFTRGGQNWADLWWDCSNPWVAELGIGELVGSAKMFGFDGVRFDGEFVATRSPRLDGSWTQPENADLEAANLALVRQMKKECWAYNPKYLFGYNAGTTITWSVPANNTPAQFREKCKDDGLIADESFAFPGDVPWSVYCLRVRAAQEIVHHYGGHYATYAFNRSGTNLYNYVFEYALRSHLMVPCYLPERAWLGRSATRFSKLLWDDSLSTWHAAADRVTVTSASPLMWKEFAAVGDAPGGGTRYIIHLINPPAAPTTFGKEQEPAAPVEDAAVTFKNLGALKQAFVVDMPATTAAPLKPEGEVFRLGPVPLWKILVVDVNEPRPPITYDQPSSTGKIGPSAQELQIAAPTGGPQATFHQVLEATAAGGFMVTDPDALDGQAVHITAHDGMWCPTYMYFYPRIPGLYKATFRLKASNNTETFGYAGECYVTEWNMHPLPGVPQLQGDVLRLRATDFAAANKYEEFTTYFQHSDVGFEEARFLHHGGSTEIWFDRVTIDLVKPWTDAELAAHYAGLAKPAGLTWAKHDTTEALMVRGLYNRLYHVDEALAGQPKLNLATAYASYGGQAGLVIKGLDWDWGPLWKQDVIILNNLETKGLSYGQMLMLREWVKEGGGLLILGGLTTLGQDNNMARGWPEFLPVVLNGPWEVRKCEPPVKVAGGNGVVLYRHMVKAKPGTTLLLKGAGGEPLLVGQSYGKGRVAVFTGTVLGEAPEGAQPFWETKEWQETVRKAVGWVSGK
jgi:hypothetical protein